MAYMVDWLSMQLPWSGPEIHGGMVLTITPGGEVERRVQRSYRAQGSYDATVAVRSSGSTLYISGNPAKWHHGHNVFGDSPVPSVAMGFAASVVERVQPGGVHHAALAPQDIRLTVVDVTRSYLLDSQEQVRAWISASGSVLNSRQRLGSYDGETLYVGQHSRRIATKVYNKGVEIRKHPPAINISARGTLMAVAQCLLRVEVRMLSMELKRRELQVASAWSDEVAEALLDERIEGLGLMDTDCLAESEVCELPGRLIGVYELWRSGRDLRDHMSRAQAYRYRAQLLPYKIDVFKLRPRVVRSEQLTHSLGRSLRSFLVGGGVSAGELGALVAA